MTFDMEGSLRCLRTWLYCNELPEKIVCQADASTSAGPQKKHMRNRPDSTVCLKTYPVTIA